MTISVEWGQSVIAFEIGRRVLLSNKGDSRPLIKKAIELGIKSFDTANVYSVGKSEEILTRALKDCANRDEVLIASRLWGRAHDGPNGAGPSRKAVVSGIDKSLKRLGTEDADLYQIHRWDHRPPSTRRWNRCITL